MQESDDDFAAEAERVRALLVEAGNALVPLGSAEPEVVRTAYGAQLAEFTRSSQNLQSIYAQRKAELEAKLRADLAALKEVMDPLQAQVKKLQEAIWTVNLYLGRDEAIEQLTDGHPAPAGTPIVLRQLVLAMDEECLVAAETGQGIHGKDIGKFTEWLLTDPAHLHQVLPDTKGVVVLVPSRQKRDYSDIWAQRAAEEANSVSYWLLRNGERLFLMTTDIKVGDRLLPTRAEFVDFFYSDRHNRDTHERERVPMDPGGEAWVKAEAAADARRRHFMRLMLVLQGLVDRTTVWQPLPGGGVNFLSVGSQDDGKVIIINELDNVLTTGRKQFREWQVEKLRALTPGQRVIGAFDSWDFRHHANDDYSEKRGEHGRLHPGRSSYPSALEPHVLETVAGTDGAMTFMFDRTVWDQDHWKERPAKTRGRCTLYPTDSWLLPFDTVTVAELEAYLNARTERHTYLTTIPIIKAAIAAKRAEAAAEAPFRLMLAGRIAAAHGLDVADVEAQIAELVDWWKLTNRWHRPLVADKGAEAKAVAAIEREWTARRTAAERGSAVPYFDQRTLATLRELHPDAMCIARRRDGHYAVYLPADDQNIWVHERRYQASGRKGLRLVRDTDWTQVPLRTLPTLTVLHAADRWARWDHRANPAEHLTVPEVDMFVAELRDGLVNRGGTPIAVTYNPAERLFRAYAWAAVPRSPKRMSGIADPGELMIGLTASWHRLKGGYAGLDAPTERDHPDWHRHSEGKGNPTPWRPADSVYRTGARLVWLDDTQMPRVNQVWSDIRDREKAAGRRSDAMVAVIRAVNKRWVAYQQEHAYQRFLVDYNGATDLWEGHLKTLKFSENVNSTDGLHDGIVAFQDEGVDLAGLTVADAVRRSLGPDKAEQVLAKLAEGVAGLPLAEDGTAD